MKTVRIISLLSIVIFTALVYRFFLSTTPFVAHDFPLLFRESRDFFSFWAISWDYMGAGGLGASALKTIWIDLYANFIYFISNSANIPWWFSQRIFWIVPFILISILSSYKFSGLFVREPIYKTLSAIIYTFNTYILLIIGGGQFGIAFSYALSPLVLYLLIKLFEQTPKGVALLNQKLLISGFLSGLIIAFDPRISVLVFGVFALWYLFIDRDFSFNKLKYIFLNFLIAGLLNSYWIIPAILYFLTGSSPTVSNYLSLPGVKFLSFATFENTMSLLHPNWPENIFGKVYFQKPEFLLIPILAFASLLFKMKKELLFFVGIGLLGIFLGKGANEPFGQTFLFLFQNIPGFNLFRDPTKFYILIALSYSILIPFSLFEISKRLKISNSRLAARQVLFIFTILYLLFLLRPAWSGELTGIFKPKDLPEEYVRLNEFLKKDKDFSRTLWIPKRQKYGFFMPLHPVTDSEILFARKDISKLSEDELSKNSIKYVIVPYDSDGEIFLKDRKYDEKTYQRTIGKVERLGFSEIVGFGKIRVYQAQTYKDHFWCDCEAKISYKFVNPAEYVVNIENAQEGDVLVFSEGFDKNWLAEDLASQGQALEAQKFEDNLNSFILPENGDYNFKVYYVPQKWVNVGLIISGLTLFGLILWLLMLYYRHDRKS